MLQRKIQYSARMSTPLKLNLVIMGLVERERGRERGERDRREREGERAHFSEGREEERKRVTGRRTERRKEF